MELIEGIDFCLVRPEKDTSMHIRFIKGPYKDTLFKFGKVKFEERHGNVHLIFAYYVLESPVMKPKKLEQDIDFKNYIGDLLVHFMSLNLDMDDTDEARTDDIENPYTE